MDPIPFLLPNLVKKESFLGYLSQIDHTRSYSNYGPLNTLFEDRTVNEIFDHVGAAVTVNNATSGLTLAIAHCKRPKARYALMPSFTFAATPLAAMWCGLEPYFVDLSEDDWCMSETLTEELLDKLGEQVAVVVPYAAFGTDMDLTYYEKLQAAGIPVVVDAAASLGTTGDNGQFGKGFSGLVVFSFHATKAFGIGEGGLVYSGNENMIRQIRQAGNFGFDAARESSIMGMNSKMSEYAAAVALATLDAFPEKKAVRQKLYNRYLRQFHRLRLFEKGWMVHRSRGIIPHQFLPLLCPEDKVNRDVVSSLAAHGIEVKTYFSPVCHRQKLFAGCPSTSLRVTEGISRRILSLPLWEEMAESDIDFITERIAEL